MDDPDKRGSGPSKATPVSIVYREDLPWLLPAVRGETPAVIPSVGPVAEIAEAIAAHGPRFLTELVTDTGRLATDVESALWEGVARGLFTADGFEAIRTLTNPGRSRADRQTRALSKLRRSGVKTAQGAGRWSLVPSPAVAVDDTGNPHNSTANSTDDSTAADIAAKDREPDRDEMVEALADQLLQRWGVLFYDLVAHENLAVPWRDLQWALRRLEDRGLVKGGRFVKGFSGEQFALAEAVEGLKRVTKTPPTGRHVTVSGSDPLNVTGVLLPGDRVPARRTEVVQLPV